MQLVHKLTPKQTLKIKQILSPKMIQMLKTFQMSYHDVVNMIETENKDNVFLEVSQYDGLYQSAKQGKALTRLNSFDSQSSDFTDRVQSKEKTLYDFVLSQLNMLGLREKDHQIALNLIENLDDRGYIPNYNEAKESIKITLKVKDRKVKEILDIIHSLEPDGVGARSLKECLLIQINEHQFESEQLRNVFQKVLTYHFDDLAEKKFEKIAKALSIEIEGAEQIASFIKTNLTPNPGQGFKNTPFTEFVIPSFEAEMDGKKLVIVNLESTQGIKIGLSVNYAKVLDDPNLDDATRTYLIEKRKKAETLIENINRRHENLENMATFILSRQTDFLKKGLSHLEPLLQKDVSQSLGISPSTVSRIVSSKFIQTPQGTFSFKALCPRSHFGKTAFKLKEMIKLLFEDNPQLSDQKMCRLLQEKGISIARRTVTKYRLESGISSKFHRFPEEEKDFQ